MTYAYSQGNRLEQPVTYMYSQFEGAPFLAAYMEDRQEAVEALVGIAGGTTTVPGTDGKAIMAAYAILSASPTFNRQPHARCAQMLATRGHELSNRIAASRDDTISPPKKAPIDENIDTGSFLQSLLLSAAGSPSHPDDLSEFDALVRRFEISKRIFPNYRRGFRNGSGDCSNILGYTLFALALCLAYRRTDSLRYLNALLKSCDILSSVRDIARSDPMAAFAAALALVAEAGFVASLASAKGVSLAS
jgi:hypothetical protein